MKFHLLINLIGLVSFSLLMGGEVISVPAPQTPPRVQPSRRLPLPPSTPPPNRTRSGGSLSDTQVCRNSPESLMALIPVENPVLTVSQQPTLFFYLPYGSAAVESAELSILVGLDESTRLTQTPLVLPENPGIARLRLPVPLAEGTPYHWYLKINCAGNQSSKPNMQVDGWVQRVAATPERDRQINAGTPEIWYDAFSTLADRLAVAPQDPKLRETWRNLLTAAGAAEVEQKAIVGEIRIVE
jgi:Domain of Unknown Function (DUF928)